MNDVPIMADGLYRFQLYDLDTRLLGQKVASTNLAVAAAQIDQFSGSGLVWGWHDEDACYVDADEHVVSRTDVALRAGLFTLPPVMPPAPVHPDAINAEAQRRILARYPLGKQITAARRGDADAMHAFIDAIVDRSNQIRALDPIPQDFAADSWWPTQENANG